MTIFPNLVVLTGAGLSAPSGVPTFRDANGLWQNHSIDDVCDFSTWKKNALLVHDFYNQLRSGLTQVKPNAAHDAIADWSHTYGESCDVFTQNVDDLCEAAGTREVTHVHGELTRMQCTSCKHTWSVGYRPWTYGEDACEKCGHKTAVKPGVVFFNEHAPAYARLMMTFRQLHERSMVIIMGTSGSVVDVSSLVYGVPGVKILNNLEPSVNINEHLFDHVFYESAHTAVEKIDLLVKAHMAS